MSNSTSQPPREAHCAECGAELPGQLGPGLCPKCLLKAGLGPPAAVAHEPTAVIGAADQRAGMPMPGEQFAHYRIIRPLGGGGMGMVFEAEDLENGRRVALKVLSHSLDSVEGRERFLREGRLAASINHPNSVYVFGTEEIGGTPVIAMELVSGGTLEERVRTRGPMPPAEAVDAVLQIIGGLDAAQRIGILHRDVKPSNCFMDSDGTVKIGDFGLSISTALRTEPALTTSGAFLGTPGFCSPEQLRGEELNVRSDIYSVGVTLFYLLTGRTPFEVKNVVAMIATVLEQPAPSPRKLRPELSPGLAKAVQRCLEKQPGERFRTYDELRRALEPYSSAAPVPATPWLRLAAGVIDTLAVSTLAAVLFTVLFADPFQAINQAVRRPSHWMWLGFSGLSGSILYYAVLEGLWGATLGKAVCRLRVVGPQKSAPGIPRALARATIFLLVPVLPFWAFFGFDWVKYVSGTVVHQFLPTICFYVALALLFVTARRRNGYAAVHDLVSGSCVICRVVFQHRPVLAAAESVPAGAEKMPSVGPYHVLETIEQSGGESWLLGYDMRLLRKVWIHSVSPGTPPIPPHLRNLGRVGRLRWMTGRRSPGENWDAFEAVSGKPLAALIREGPQPWSQVRFWLSDLAQELGAARKDGTLPAVLELHRVWVTADGRAKLLDFPAPGLDPRPPAEFAVGPAQIQKDKVPQQFLAEIAAAALEGNGRPASQTRSDVALPLPVHAREFLRRLKSLPDVGSAARELALLLHRPAVVTRFRRAAIMGACCLVPFLAIFAGIFSLSVLQTFEKRYPGLMQLNILLTQRSSRVFAPAGARPTDRQIAIYIASHYQSIITNSEAWSNLMVVSLIKGEARQFAERSLAEHPSPTPEEVKEAEAAIDPILPKSVLPNILGRSFFPVMVFTVTLAIYVGIPAMLAALAFRGGLVLLIAGVSFVRRDGQRASRLRLFWRSIIAWGPVWPACLVAAYYMEKPFGWAGVALTLGLCSLVALSLAMPKRGLPDLFAGTWPVPK